MNKFLILIFFLISCGVPKLRLADEQPCSETDLENGNCINRVQQFELAPTMQEKLKQKYESLNLICNFRRIIETENLKRTLSQDFNIDLLSQFESGGGFVFRTPPYIVELQSDNLELNLTTQYLMKFEDLELFEGLISDSISNFDLKRSFIFNLDFKSIHRAIYSDDQGNVVEEMEDEPIIKQERFYEISSKEIENELRVLDHNEEIYSTSTCLIQSKLYPDFLTDYRRIDS